MSPRPDPATTTQMASGLVDDDDNITGNGVPLPRTEVVGSSSAGKSSNNATFVRLLQTNLAVLILSIGKRYAPTGSK